MGMLKVFDGQEYKPVGVIVTIPLEKVYPVGAIYISTVATNPTELFGFGEWQQIKDRFILAAGDTYEAGSTGGEAEHKLTIDEMASHSHPISQLKSTDTGYVPAGSDAGSIAIRTDVNGVANQGGTFTDRAGNSETTRLVIETGGSQPHNNMPPYLTVYMWQRIA